MVKFKVEFTHADDVMVEAETYAHDELFVTFYLAGNRKAHSFRTAEVRSIRKVEEGKT